MKSNIMKPKIDISPMKLFEGTARLLNRTNKLRIKSPMTIQKRRYDEHSQLSETVKVSNLKDLIQVDTSNKKYQFGLTQSKSRSVSPQPQKSPTPEKIPDEVSPIDQIFDMQDAPSKQGVFVPEIMSTNSVATRSKDFTVNRISYIRDLSEASRQLTNLHIEDEIEMLSKRLEQKKLSSSAIDLTQDTRRFTPNAIDYVQMQNFVLGRYPRIRLASIVNQMPYSESFERLSEPEVLEILRKDPELDPRRLKLKQSTLIEDTVYDIIQLMRQKKPPEEKVLNKKVTKAALMTAASESRLNQNEKLRAKMMFQFVKEYQNLKKQPPSSRNSTLRKPAVPRFPRSKSPRVAPQRPLPITPPRPRQGESRLLRPTQASLQRQQPSISNRSKTPEEGWIGGSKFSREEWTDDWETGLQSLQKVPSFGESSDAFVRDLERSQMVRFYDEDYK